MCRTMIAAMLVAALLVPTGAALSREPAAAATAKAAPRVAMLRFEADLAGHVPPPGDDHVYHPQGALTVRTGADPRLAPGTARAYLSVVHSNVDGKGGFVSSVTWTLPGGEIALTGVYPTHNEPTPIAGTAQTVMVHKVTGGTGIFEGASGYLVVNSTLANHRFQGTVAGLVFVPERE